MHGAIGKIDGIGDVYHLSGLVWRNGHGHGHDEVNSVNSEIFSPCAAASLYRRAALVDVGGFDEDFFCYMEDVDLGFWLCLPESHGVNTVDRFQVGIDMPALAAKVPTLVDHHG